MIWVVAFFIIILISSVLAYRSMRDYEEFPDELSLNSVFFVGNIQNFTLETLHKLHKLFLSKKQFFSIERLYKGKERVLIIYGSRELLTQLSELNLVELEDYLVNETYLLSATELEKKVNVNQALTWMVEPKNNLKRSMHIGPELRNLELRDHQRVFIQIISMPIEKGEEAVFQSTIRVMVADPDPIERVGLSKRVDQVISAATGLHKLEDQYPEIKKFESFRERTLIPKEVSEFPLTSQEIYEILI